MLIQDITMTEFVRYLKETRTLIIPIGTVEEHGSHLPLSTDTMVVWEMVKEVERRVPVFLAPPIHYGVCTSTSQHPGTIGISFDTLRGLLKDIVISSYEKGLRRFFLISGHAGGSHMTAMKEAGEELVRLLDGIEIASLSVYDLILKEAMELAETENDSHAGEIETSLMLYINEPLVKGRSKEEYPQFPKPFIVRDKVRYWKGGVWGNPDKATIEKGERLFNIGVERIAGLIGPSMSRL